MKKNEYIFSHIAFVFLFPLIALFKATLIYIDIGSSESHQPQQAAVFSMKALTCRAYRLSTERQSDTM